MCLIHTGKFVNCVNLSGEPEVLTIYIGNKSLHLSWYIEYTLSI